MPCRVKVWGRRGAIGAKEGIFVANSVTRSSLGLRPCLPVPYIGSNARIARWGGVPAPGVVGACLVCLGCRPGKDLMLFNSYPFIFLFLPVVLLGYFALGRRGNVASV